MSSPGHSGDEHIKLSPSKPTSNVTRNCNAKTLALAAAIACTIGGAAVAQTNAPGTTANPGSARTDDRGFDWGWLGLLGLAGLAGLSG
jgi:hypothetical protein